MVTVGVYVAVYVGGFLARRTPEMGKRSPTPLREGVKSGDCAGARTHGERRLG